MDNSLLLLEMYPIIFKYLPWGSLEKMQSINRYFYWLTQKERTNRWNSEHPLGDPSAKFVIITEGFYLENIFCDTDKTKVWISPKSWTKVWFKELFEKYFFYSIYQQKYVMTNYLFQQLIRYTNHKRSADSQPVDEFRQTIVFSNKTSQLKIKTFY